MITQRFTKPVVRDLRNELEKVLNEFASKHGIVASLGNARFSADNVKWSFNLACPDAVGGDDVDSVEAVAFLSQCHLYGMAKTDLNATVNVRGTLVKIVGLNTRRHKYPVICEQNGKRYVYSDREIVQALLAEKIRKAGG